MSLPSRRETLPSSSKTSNKLHSLIDPLYNHARRKWKDAGKKFKLLSLPDDLLLCVADCLETEKDINAFARVNHHLHRLLNDYLYRHNIQHAKSSALVWAVLKGQITTVRRLLEQGADVEVKSGHVDLYPRAYIDVTPLWLATYAGHVRVVELLLQANANPEPRDDHTGKRPLHLAASQGYKDILCLLLEKTSVNPDRRTGKGKTPLFCAVKHGRVDIVKRLLEEDAVDINTNRAGPTPLINAICRGSQRQEIVDILLQDKRIKLERQSPDPRWSATPLQAAASLGQKKTVKQLLEKKVDVNFKETDSSPTALSRAVSNRHEAIVKMLLDYGADVNAHYSGQGETVLMAASSQSSDHIARLLLDAGARVNARGGLHGDALQTASRASVPVAKLLLSRGADVNAEGIFYASALHAAADSGHTELVQILLDMGANVNTQTKRGGSALQSAAYGGHIDIVKMLLERGADVHARGDRWGNALRAALTGQQIRRTSGHETVISLLRGAGAGDVEPASASQE